MQQSSRIAIYALIELASNPDRQLSAAEIGEKYRISAHHLAKVLMTLGRAGLVKATRGVGGGYSFIGNAKRLNLLDVISLFEDTSMGCKLADPSTATAEEWALFDISKEIKEISMSTYASITIATMLKQIERRKKAAAAKNKIGAA
ncbi:Rrf2 family transcriptional regulator [Ruegeria marisrubri]|uniref:Rrf2 family transcriptional regulator n=1 Tax=Ruegeria marisrubri TaxID=1685379 RepID=UPI000A781641|nr:Rrf2 family transcriptional regulator [Ruegeria marisrubri]